MNAQAAQLETAAPSTNRSKKDPSNPAAKAKATPAPSVPLIVPDGQPTSEDQIRYGAYFRWEAAGRPDGDGVDFWLDSENELRQQSARTEPA
jgi:hypothetical protein